MTLEVPTSYRREGIRNRNANPNFVPKCLRCMRLIEREILIKSPKGSRCMACRIEREGRNKGRKR
jgi:hypothetical protein